MSGSMRIGDPERERAAAELGEHFALGRISGEEHGERLDAVWSARTQADLDVLFADLPPQAPPGVPARRGRTETRPDRHRGWHAVPFVPILVALGVLTVVTHLPFILIALAIGAFLWSRANRRRQRHHDGWTSAQSPGWR